MKLIDVIKTKFQKFNKDNLKKNTELVLLLLDMMTCPYIEKVIKKELLRFYGVSVNNTQDNIIEFSKYWFIKWQGFNLAEEIEMKKSQEVYS
jgi:hypothetical protein